MSRWLTSLAFRVRSLFRRRRAEDDLDEEMQFHLDREIHERVKRGLTPKEARYAALRAMGAIEKNKDECRDVRSGESIAASFRGLPQDLKFAVRLVRKHPAPAGIAIGGLAIAIGVVTAAFSIVNATMLRPFGMDDPSSVVHVAAGGHGGRWTYWSYPKFLRMQTEGTLARVEGSVLQKARLTTTPADENTTGRWLLLVSGGYFNMLGGRPSVGRALEPADDAPGAPPVVAISHHFWKTALHADPAAIGTTMWINGIAATIVGVIRPEFTGPVDFDLRPAVWAPLAAIDDLQMGLAPGPTAGPTVDVIGRVAPGGSLRTTEEQLAAIVTRGAPPSSSDEEHRGPAVQLTSASSPISGPAEADVTAVLASVAGIVGLVLALACANTANLLMASAATRAREVGVRLALGASRRRIVRQMVNESLLLGLVAGGCGFLLAVWMVPLIGSIVSLPPEVDIAPDGRALLFTVAIAIVCGLGAGLSPARFGARGNVLAALQAQSGSHPAGSAAAPSRLRTSFVGFQAAVSMLLLVTAALFTRTAINMSRLDVGFDPDRLLAVSVEPQKKGLDQAAYVRAALAALRELPSVEQAAITRVVPLGGSRQTQNVTVGGVTSRLNVIRADASYLATVGVRIVRGRGFTMDEASGEAPVALISNNAARTIFGASDPVGQIVTTPAAKAGQAADSATIVGVVSDALLVRTDNPGDGIIYRPLSEKTSSGSYSELGLPLPPQILVRALAPGRAARPVEEALRRVNPTVLPTTEFVGAHVESYRSTSRAVAWVFGPPAFLALVLAALGVYGVTAFVVGQRRAEVSVRMALGASSRDVLRMLVTDSLRPVLIGLVVGLAGALAFGRVSARMLSGVKAYDPIAIAAALTILLGCALAAVLMPARRAAKADPAGLLRQV